MTMLRTILWRGFSLWWGATNGIIYMVMSILDRSAFRKRSPKAEKELAAARDKFWSLTREPQGLKHRFFTVERYDGIKLHYVESIPPPTSAHPSSPAPDGYGLVIFLHGFPDSWVLWKELLRSDKLYEKAVLIAVDLPGYGGSDNLPSYGPDHTLEVMTAFILGMRDQYITADSEKPRARGKVLVVSHDWGSVVGFRLASEAPQVADRFIISSAFLPNHTLSNVKSRWASACQMVRTWTHQPRSIRLFRSAVNTLRPIAAQVGMSGYAFVFNLPAPLANFIGPWADYWFLRLCHQLAAKQKHPLEGVEAAEAMASSLGPGIEQCVGDDGYPEAVRLRVRDGGWSEKIRYYRENLALGAWRKELETILALSELDREGGRRRSSSSTGALLEDGPKGVLHARATIIYGANDAAFEPRLGLEGIGDYLVRDSQMLLVPRGGHWIPQEKAGVEVYEEVIRWALEGENGSLRKRIEAVLPSTKIAIEK